MKSCPIMVYVGSFDSGFVAFYPVELNKLFWMVVVLLLFQLYQAGVPQGTVLGPLLFLCYVNEIPSCVSSNIRLYADDILMYRVITCDADSDELQKDLVSLQRWSDE